jgi:pimeloyl-ACP methyl ester carboxylesterase
VSETSRLSSGGELRVTNGGARRAVVCVNGGQGKEVEGTWSATIEFLVRELAPSFPAIEFAEVRYRVKSWRALDRCIEDCTAAVAATTGPVLLLGFSMGGAVAISSAGDPRVERVVGLAPWIPDRLDLAPLQGKRLDVIHGSLDRWLPGVPGVSPSLSRSGFERARALGALGSYTLIRGGVHGIALRAPPGRLVPLPRASAWARLVAAQLADFAG